MDEQLQNLIQELCQHSESSPKRRRVLNQLLLAIQQLPGLYKDRHPDYPIALNQTWEWVCRKICQFEQRPPSLQASLTAWINGHLKWRIKDLYTGGHPDYMGSNPGEISLDNTINNNDGNQIPLSEQLLSSQMTINLLDELIEELHKTNQERLGEKVRKHILQDGQNLRACHPRKHPECHCQLLAERLLLQEPPDAIASIAREFNINNQALYSHWKRKCLPLLQEIALNYGYEK